MLCSSEVVECVNATEVWREVLVQWQFGRQPFIQNETDINQQFCGLRCAKEQRSILCSLVHFGWYQLRRSYKLQGYPMADTAPMQAHASPQSKTAQTSRTLIPSTMERVCATDTAMDDKMHCQQTGGIGSYKMRAAAP
jgi:hypothetical protein